MKKAVCLIMLLGIGTAAFAADVRETKTDWGSILVPKEVKAGEKLEVTIRIEDPSAMDAVRVDLHARKAEGGYAGFLRWGGEARTVNRKGELVFSISTVPQKGAMEFGSVHPLVLVLIGKPDAYETKVQVVGPDVNVRSP